MAIERLDPVGEQVRLELFALGGLGGAGVRGDRVPLLAQQRGHVVRLRDGQRVDDARTGQRVEVRGEPRRALRGIARLHHRQPQRLPVEPAAQHQRCPGRPRPAGVATSSTTRSLAVAVVASTGMSAPSSAISVRIRR